MRHNPLNVLILLLLSALASACESDNPVEDPKQPTNPIDTVEVDTTTHFVYTAKQGTLFRFHETWVSGPHLTDRRVVRSGMSLRGKENVIAMLPPGNVVDSLYLAHDKYGTVYITGVKGSGWSSWPYFQKKNTIGKFDTTVTSPLVKMQKRDIISLGTRNDTINGEIFETRGLRKDTYTITVATSGSHDTVLYSTEQWFAPELGMYVFQWSTSSVNPTKPTGEKVLDFTLP